MEKIKDILRNKNNRTILIFLIISLAFFGILINMEYATDTYTVFIEGGREDVKHFLGDGRFISAFFTCAFKVLNLNEITIYLLSYCAAIIFLVISLNELKKIIDKSINNETISIIISVLILVNTFIIELFLFIEKGIMIFSILMSILAIKNLLNFFERRNYKILLKVLILMFLANGAYQGTVGIFLAISAIYVIKNSKNIKEFIVNNLIIGICYIVPAFIDVIIAKLCHGKRVATAHIVFMESFKAIMIQSVDMCKSYKIVPKYLFAIFTLIILIIMTYYIIIKKDKLKFKVLNILSILYIIIVTFAVAVLPQLAQSTDLIWMTPRSTYAFASLPGVLLLNLFVNILPNENIIKIKKDKLITILLLFTVLYIAIECKGFLKIEVERYKVNAVDRYVTLQIVDKIKEYEMISGNKIDQIVTYNDKLKQYSYDDITIIRDINTSAYSADWSAKGIIAYYKHKRLTTGEDDFTIKEKFEKNNWNYYNDNQLIFKEDTVYVCCY